MGYYGSEYEEYYRNIRSDNLRGKNHSRKRNYSSRQSYSERSSYSNGQNNSIRSSYSSGQNYSRISRNGGNKNNNHLLDFLKILLIQVIAVAIIGGILYTTGLSKKEKLQEVKNMVDGIVSTDYYFNEDDYVTALKDKVLNGGETIWGIGIEKDPSVDAEKKKEPSVDGEKKKDEKIDEKENVLEKFSLKIPTVGKETYLKDGKVKIKGNGKVFSVKEGKITYVKNGKVIVDHGEKLETVYENLKNVTVKRGEKIEMNQILGINDEKKDGVIFCILKDGKIQNIKEEV